MYIHKSSFFCNYLCVLFRTFLRSREYQRVEYPFIICLVSMTLDAYRNKPFEVVIDFTHTSVENRFKVSFQFLLIPIILNTQIFKHTFKCMSVEPYVKLSQRIFFVHISMF